MESYEMMLYVILAAIIGMFVYFVCALSNLKDDMRRMYMNSASYYTVRDAKKEILTEMDDQIDKVMTEIACLATKNNADIQRVKDGFQVGDVIEIGHVRYLVTKRIMKAGSNGSLAGYMVVRNDGTSEYREIEDMGDAKFIKHLDGLEDAFS